MIDQPGEAEADLGGPAGDLDSAGGVVEREEARVDQPFEGEELLDDDPIPVRVREIREGRAILAGAFIAQATVAGAPFPQGRQAVLGGVDDAPQLIGCPGYTRFVDPSLRSPPRSGSDRAATPGGLPVSRPIHLARPLGMSGSVTLFELQHMRSRKDPNMTCV